jgi:hypothetical protein
MDVTRYIEDIRRQLDLAAEAGGEDARALADRLVAPLDAAIRLALQDALAAAAEEITVELAPGSVEVRLRGRDPEFVVTPPPTDPSVEDPGEEEALGWGGAPQPLVDGEEHAVSRINLRLPEHLKSRIERAAAVEGLSVNSWLVRAAAAALDRTDPARRRERRTPRGRQRYSGWAR